MSPSTLGPYRLDRELGSGGMGKVYAATVTARCPGLAEGAVVALKVVHPHLLETPGFFKRFLREAEIGKSVVHENVVRTFDCDSMTADGKRADFLVMEYVEGQTLRDLLKELERVPEELCRHIGREVAKGLAAIHAAGVIHRDMKPENVLITKEHEVKVMDLGVARLQDEAMRLSQTGAFVGSIHYAAPECFSEGGKHVDGRADLHALGLVLYELSSGVNPYYAETVPEILKRILHEEPRRLGDVNPQLSAFFEAVVHCLLAKDPASRFADANALLAVLAEGEKSAWWSARSNAIRAETRRPLRRIRIPRETALYGRDEELALLRARFDRASKGDGQVVLLDGEAGIGKSRLVDEFVGLLQREGADLHFLFGSYPPGGAASAAGALGTALREYLGDAGIDESLRGLLGVAGPLAPAFAALLLGAPAPPGAEPLTRDSIQSCFVAAARSLAAERTTVLLVDDLHFASDEGLSLFTALATAAPGHRLLLLGTTRPGIDERWLAGVTRLPQTSRMAIGRLGPKDLVALLKDSFRSEALASSLSAQIATKSDGNPFFAFEIIRGLREGQFITQRDDGTWVSTRAVEEIRIPSSVLDLVNARVADLTQEERDLLDVAACWGFEFDPLLIGEVVGLARIPLLKVLSRTERKHRLVRSAGQRFVFDHHQVQEALYEGLPELLRESYHAGLAEALEARTSAAGKDPGTLDGALCVDLCEHFLRGARGESALRYLKRAQAHLGAGHLHGRIVALTERALAVEGLLTGLARLEALETAASSLEVLGREERWRERAEEAARIADASGDAAARARAHRLLGHHLERTGKYDAASRELELAIALARSAGDVHVEGQAANCLGSVLTESGRLEEAAVMYARLIDHLRTIGDRLGEMSAVGNLGLVHVHQGRAAEAREHYRRSLDIALEIGDRGGALRAFANLGVAFLSSGDLAEAKDHFERSLALCRETGQRRGEGINLLNLGLVLTTLGDRARARESLLLSRAICRELRARYPEGYVLLGLGNLADEDGDAAEALARMEESLSLRREIGHAVGVADSLTDLGDLRSRTGDVEGACAALDESAALCRTQGRAAHLALTLAIRARLPGGDVKAAEAACAEVGDDFGTVRPRFALWIATRDRAHLAGAKRQLDRMVGRAPPEFRDALISNVRLHREIAEACRAEGIG